MNAERHQQVKVVFNAVRELPEQEREAFLEKACGEDAELVGEVRSLLEYDDAPTQPALQTRVPENLAKGAQAVGLPSLLHRTIGDFRIQRVIASGGMGTVYEAWQEPPRRKVALKALRRGLRSASSLRRFEYESEILGRLRHPGVAQVYGAGTFAEGEENVPYFVMEFIEGAMSITEYARRNEMSIEDRLDLFVKVCDAVHHAHQKGIIHRDLKPGNILVDSSGQPKIIDFGVARITDGELEAATLHTSAGEVLGTLAYMSPEQTTMGSTGADDASEVDTRSDIYSLGVVLYELLTSSAPLTMSGDATLFELQRMVVEVDPPRPSARVSNQEGASASEPRTLAQQLRGDLDWIVMKCLEKSPARRYETAEALAGDVRRHLQHEPVLAGPPSATYRMRKFVRRHRVGVATATVIAATMLAGTIVSVGYAVSAEGARVAESEQRLIAEVNERRAVEAARRAEREAKRAAAAEEESAERARQVERVAEFQAKQLADLDVPLMGVRLRDAIFEKRRSALEGAGRDDEQIEKSVRELEEALASVNFTNVALESLDENILDRSLAAVREQFEDQPLVKARLLQTIADTAAELGLLDRAAAPQERALEIRRSMAGDEHLDTLVSMTSKGTLLQQQGRHAEAEPHVREALEISTRVLGDEHVQTLASIANMGSLRSAQGRLDEAEHYFRRALEGTRRAFGEEHRRTARALSGLGTLLWERGNLAEAEERYLEALAIARRVLGAGDPTTLQTLNNLGVLSWAQGRLPEAMEYLAEAMDGCIHRFGDEHPKTLTTMNNVAYMFRVQGELTEAESRYRQVLETRRRILGDTHPDTLTSVNVMGDLRQAQGELPEAEAYYREALEGRRNLFGEDHSDTLRSLNNVGSILQERGHLAGAEAYHKAALKGRRRLLGPEHTETLLSLNNVGGLLWAQGLALDAEPYFRESLETSLRVHGNEHPDTLRTMVNLSALLRELDRLEEAEQLGAEAVQGGLVALPPGHWTRGAHLSHYGRTLAAMQRFEEAEEALIEALRIIKEALGSEDDRAIAAFEFLADLYDAWHEQDPDAGHDTNAARWRAKLLAAEAQADGNEEESAARADGE